MSEEGKKFVMGGRGGRARSCLYRHGPCL